jgi:hypothetical protein
VRHVVWGLIARESRLRRARRFLFSCAHPGAACAASSLRSGGRQGSPLCSDERARERRALDCHPHCGCFAARKSISFSCSDRNRKATATAIRAVAASSDALRSGSERRSAGAVAGIRGVSTGGGTHSKHQCAIRQFGPPQTPSQNILGVHLGVSLRSAKIGY